MYRGLFLAIQDDFQYITCHITADLSHLPYNTRISDEVSKPCVCPNLVCVFLLLAWMSLIQRDRNIHTNSKPQTFILILFTYWLSES